MPADVASTLEVLKVLAELEFAVAQFYAACAQAYLEDHNVWEGLEDEEQLHAARVERMAQDMERSILETRYGVVVKGTHPEFRALAIELATATAAHRCRIAAHAATVAGRR